MLQNLMNSKEVNYRRKGGYDDDNYRLSMPLQQEEGSAKHHQQFKKSLNFDRSENENSVILGNPSLNFPQNMDQMIDEESNQSQNDIYSVYHQQIQKVRQSKNGAVYDQNTSGQFNDTNMVYSNNPAGTTVATSRMQTADRNTQKAHNDTRMSSKFQNIIEEENSGASHMYQYSEEQKYNNIPSPYYDQESVRNSANQYQIMNHPSMKTAQRYNQPQFISGIKNSISQEEYESINNAFGNKIRESNTRNRNNIQKSSEFTFVGRKVNQSPHDNLTNRNGDFIHSTRQSIILNPLTDVNVTSTTKKQNYQRNFNEPQRMNNIEEERNTPQNEFEESQNLPQYYETDAFSQQNLNDNFNQANEQDAYTSEEIQKTIKQNYILNNFLEAMTSENQNMREILESIEQSLIFISENCTDPKTVRDESMHSLDKLEIFFNQEGIISQLQAHSVLDEQIKRSTMQFDSQMEDGLS